MASSLTICALMASAAACTEASGTAVPQAATTRSTEAVSLVIDSLMFSSADMICLCLSSSSCSLAFLLLEQHGKRLRCFFFSSTVVFLGCFFKACFS